MRMIPKDNRFSGIIRIHFDSSFFQSSNLSGFKRLISIRRSKAFLINRLLTLKSIFFPPGFLCGSHKSLDNFIGDQRYQGEDDYPDPVLYAQLVYAKGIGKKWHGDDNILQ